MAEKFVRRSFMTDLAENKSFDDRQLLAQVLEEIRLLSQGNERLKLCITELRDRYEMSTWFGAPTSSVASSN